MPCGWIEPNKNSPKPLIDTLRGRQSIIVTGSRGVGKSRLIQELERSSENHPRVISANQNPRSEDWSALTSSHISLRHWQAMWRQLTLLSVASHVCEQLEDDTSVKIRDFLISKSVITETAQIILKHPYGMLRQIAFLMEGVTEAHLKKWLQDDKWSDLETTLRGAMKSLAPIAISFDGLDLFAPRDPVLATEAQAGLAMFLDRYAEAPINNVHLWAALDSKALRFAEYHNNHNLSQSHSLCEIVWTSEAFRSLLNAHIREESGGEGEGIEYLVSTRAIDVLERSAEEEPANYLMRHSSLSAGDLVYMIVNLNRHRDYLGRAMTGPEFREQVSGLSIHVARTRIKQAALEIVALSATPAEVTIRYSDRTSEVRLTEAAVIEKIKLMKREVFTRADFNRVFYNEWNPNTVAHLANILWANRLITVRTSSPGCRKIHQTHLDELRPADKRLAFNPIVGDLAELTLERCGISFEYR